MLLYGTLWLILLVFNFGFRLVLSLISSRPFLRFVVLGKMEGYPSFYHSSEPNIKPTKNITVYSVSGRWETPVNGSRQY